MKCSICGCEISGLGNNPFPVVKDPNARCCDACNVKYVIPERLKELSPKTIKN